jgi:hypothetical protein
MFDRELTRLIGIAKHYLDAADSLAVPDEELARTVSAGSASWSADLLAHPLSLVDTYSVHLASCATRLATIHEILVGGTKARLGRGIPERCVPHRHQRQIRELHRRSRSSSGTMWDMPRIQQPVPPDAGPRSLWSLSPPQVKRRH